MSRENSILDREILENMKDNVEIPWETEEKMQKAYDVIRQQCQAHRNATTKKEGNKIMKMDAPVRKKKKKFMVSLVAAAVLATSSLCVFAAMHYFETDLAVEADKATYTFEVNYDLQPVTVSAEPGYLPEGMVADGGGKYYPEGEYGHGISIIPINTLNMEQMQKQMSFDSVEKVEKKVIQGMEAHVIVFEEAEKYRSAKDIFLFNPQEGYVLWVYGDYNISLEELEKVAENLEITVEAGTADIPDDVESDIMVDTELEAVYSKGLQKTEITAVGEELKCESTGCGFTVVNTQVYDSIKDIPGYTEKGVISPEKLTPWLNEDGTHKPYQRTHYDENGNMMGEEQAKPKFLAVTVEARQYSESEMGNTPLDASLVRMVNRADGTLGWAMDQYYPVPSEEYELQLDRRCFYLDITDKSQNDKDFFYQNMAKDEKVTYTLIFAVDADILAEEDTELVLNFNATGNSPYEPQYSAITVE